jgi:hypothetical protein
MHGRRDRIRRRVRRFAAADRRAGCGQRLNIVLWQVLLGAGAVLYGSLLFVADAGIIVNVAGKSRLLKSVKLAFFDDRGFPSYRRYAAAVGLNIIGLSILFLTYLGYRIQF